MCRSKVGVVVGIIAFSLCLTCLFQSDHPATAAHFEPCRVPPIVSQAEKSNVMLILDMSGSMQFSPYWAPPVPPYSAPGDTYTAYRANWGEIYMENFNQYRSYFGIFDPNAYYKYDWKQDKKRGDATTGDLSSADDPGDYFYEVDPSESVAASIQNYSVTGLLVDVTDTKGGMKVYTVSVRVAEDIINLTAGTNGDCVILRDMTLHGKLLDNKPWKVLTKDTGARTFTIEFSFDARDEAPTESPSGGTEYEDCTGLAATRVVGNIDEGMSGNVLNWAAMSRYDNALAAFIGGKIDSCGDTYCLVKGQSCIRNARSTISVEGRPDILQAYFYVRPGDWSSAAGLTYDETENSSGQYAPKISYLSISPEWKGKLDTNDPTANYNAYGSRNGAEVYTFTLDRPTRVEFRMQERGTRTSSNDVDPVLNVYLNKSTPSGTPNYRDNDSDGWPNARIIADLPAGTHCLEATTEDNWEYGEYTLYVNAVLEPSAHAYHDGEKVSPLSAIPMARIALSKAAEEATGIIQDTFEKVRYGFMIFNTNGSNRGKIVVGCDNTSLDTLLDAIQGKGSYSWVYPWQGTPTGEALWAAYEYFTQLDGVQSHLADNSDFITDTKDPYKSATGYSSCRTSYLLVVSDGEWNGYYDPMKPAYYIHTRDLRGPDYGKNDIEGKQTVEVYSVFSFSEDELGENSMKEVAMYGGFVDKDGDGWPWVANRSGPNHFPPERPCSHCSDPLDEVDGSKNFLWPMKGCCTCTTGAWCSGTDPLHNKPCCPYEQLGPAVGSGAQPAADPAWCGPSGTYDVEKCSEWAFPVDYTEHRQEVGGVTYAKTGRYGLPTNYFFSDDGTAITRAVTAIISEVESPHAAGGTVATVSQEIRGQDIILRAVFDAVDENVPEISLWFGHLEAYLPFVHGDVVTYAFEHACNVDTLCHKMPGSGGGDCPATGNCWDAALYMSPTKRTIYAWDDDDADGKVDDGELKTLNASSAHARTWAQVTADFTEALKLTQDHDCDLDGRWADDRDDAETLLRWVLGEQQSCYRIRKDADDIQWLLGDVVYSTPVIVGVPSLGAVSKQDSNISEFLAFRNKLLEGDPSDINFMSLAHPPGIAASETAEIAAHTPTSAAQVMKRVVYVGANDGMIHAYVLAVWDWENKVWVHERDTGHKYKQFVGEELWAYVPRNFLPLLKEYAALSYGNTGCRHRTAVDLVPRPKLVYIKYKDEEGNEQVGWRIVIVGGERGGGDVYFALDVTNPDDPKLLWEFSVIKDFLLYTSSTSGNGGSSELPEGCYWNLDRKWRWNRWCDMNRLRNYCRRCYHGWRSWCNRVRNNCCKRDSSSSVRCDDACLCDLYNNGETVWFNGDSGPPPPDPNSGGGGGAVTTAWRVADELRSNYEETQFLPLSWSAPAIGRLKLPAPDEVKFYVGDPDADGNPTGVFDPNNQPTEPMTRHVAFIGGGFRFFDQAYLNIATEEIDLLRHPYFMMIDMETGENLLRYVWPYLRSVMPNNGADLFPEYIIGPSGNDFVIPYAMSHPTAVDVMNSRDMTQQQVQACESGTPEGSCFNKGDDGLIDAVYVGDLSGYLWGIKFNFHPDSTNKGIWMDLWPLKGIEDSELSNYSYFRSFAQPITTKASVSLDADDTDHLRIIVGAGKYDDVVSGYDDKTDPAKTSLFNLKDAIELPNLAVNAANLNTLDVTNSDAVFGGEILTNSGLHVFLKPRCGMVDLTTRLSIMEDAQTESGDRQCMWIAKSGVNEGNPDCCEKNVECANATPCWACVYDLQGPDLGPAGTTEGAVSGASVGDPGERFVSARVFGGLVFATSFIPNASPCFYLGTGYLYIFHYLCKEFPEDFFPVKDQKFFPFGIYKNQSEKTGLYGVRLSLGAGRPSEAVLDSSGDHVLVQMSDGTIIRIGVDLLYKNTTVRGWREAQ